jgi:hypothetical protein
MVFDPAGDITVYRIVDTAEGKGEQLVAQTLAAVLPASSGLPQPAVGFLNNALVGEALTTLILGRVRYSTNVRLLDGDAVPGAPWVQQGAGGTITSDGSLLTIDDTDVADHLFLERTDETDLDSEAGFFFEARVRVDDYEVGGEVDPVREITGVGISFDDATSRYYLCFAEAGPPHNKVAFLATQSDLEQNLLDIRAEKESVEGTFASVDWTQARMYRLERTVAGKILLYIDDSEEPSIELDDGQFSPAPTAGTGKRVSFGSLLNDRKSASSWEYFRYSISDGFDVSVFPKLSENEVLARFDHAVNAIVEADEI